MSKISRRMFTQSSLAALAASPALAAEGVPATDGDPIRLGFIGVGNRGTQVMKAFMEHDDCQVVALCDVDSRILAKAAEVAKGSAKQHEDFRRVLDDPNVDAVVIATPDHWHAVQTTMACAAGKDVYVEKPLSVTIVEGRKMVESARHHKRVVQVGTHRRSSPLYTELARRAKADEFGKITVARAYRLSNMFPNGIGRSKTQAPPSHLNWDMWLGPRPERPYQDNIHPYKFRWWIDYSSQTGNWGIHYLDAMLWCMGETAPKAVCSMGGKFAVDDDRTIPDTMESCFEFASGRLAIFGQYEANGNPVLRRGELELRGTKGTVYVGGEEFEVFPERRGQFQTWNPSLEPEKFKVTEHASNHAQTVLHARNFLDCIRTREKPHADVELGHRSTTLSLMANISQKLGVRLEWDAENERFTNCDKANELLHYEYRAPWKLA
jgi:predicted dehydrogenase